MKKEQEKKAIIKIEVSVPEAIKALQEFKNNRVAILRALSNKAKAAVQYFLKT